MYFRIVLASALLVPFTVKAENLAVQENQKVEESAPKTQPARSKPNQIMPTVILPQGILLPYYASSNQTISERYQANGTKESLLGHEVKLKANVFGVQYGLTNSTTLHLQVASISSSQMKLTSRDKLQTSREYAAVRAATTAGVASKLAAAGLCPDVPTCTTQIQNGLTFPVSDAAAGYSAGMEVTSYIDNLSDDYFRTNVQKDGATGIGDLMMAVQNHVLQIDAFALKSRGELVLPTGKFDVEPNQLPTGGGKYVARAVASAEYAFHPGVITLLEHGLAYDVTASKADGLEKRYEGFGQKGGLFLLLDPGQFVQPLNFVAFSTSYNYNYQPSQSQKTSAGKLDNIPQSRLNSTINKIRFSAMNYGFPLMLDFVRETPLNGKAVNATNNDLVILSAGARI